MTDLRRNVGETGERLAAAYLIDNGLRVVARNFEVDAGEIDLMAIDGRSRVAIEVRTITGNGEPMQAMGSTKVDHVGRLGRRVGADRIDLVAIRLRPDAAELRWVRDAS